MNLDEFMHSTKKDNPPGGISEPLLALWWDKKGGWEKAHQLAQEVHGQDGAWVHAYLHRKEGDEFNAGYWYRRASRPKSSAPFEREWQEIAKALLNQ